MQAVKASHNRTAHRSNRKIGWIAILTVCVMIGALYSIIAFRASQAPALPPGTVVISQSMLEEQYGLRVNLLAVTAAGGFVDVRFKIVDGEKLKRLLPDAKNFPVLRSEKGALLNVPEDTKSQKIEFVTGGNLFIMYPNALNAVKQNAPVMILFGNIALESIQAK
jgi:hypothetical protein